MKSPRAMAFGGVYQVTCPNPALHEEHQEVDLHHLSQQVRALGGAVDTTEATRDQRQGHCSRAAPPEKGEHHPRKLDLSWSVTERDEEDRHGEWRGTIPLQQAQAPCGVCGRHLEDDQRFRFWWLARPREACHRKRSRSRRQGERSVWGSYPGRDRSAAPENIPTHGNSAQDPSEVRPRYPEGDSPTTTVRDTVAITYFECRGGREPG